MRLPDGTRKGDKVTIARVNGAAPVLTEDVLRELPPDQRTPLGCLAFLPASIFSTAFRDLQGALVEDQVVAFIASFAGEGASTAALATAVSAALAPARLPARHARPSPARGRCWGRCWRRSSAICRASSGW